MNLTYCFIEGFVFGVDFPKQLILLINNLVLKNILLMVDLIQN